MLEWFQNNDTLLLWVGIASVTMFLGSLILVPILVAKMDADYFMPDRPKRFTDRHPILHAFAFILKNLLGFIFILMGLIMLFIPGQGLLTLLLGLALVDFPGKRAAELRLISFPPLRKSIDWIRDKAHKPPLRFPTS